MKSWLLIPILLLLVSCSKSPEKVPVVYYDADMVTGIYTEQYWFEGELYDGDSKYSGYVTNLKFLGKRSDHSFVYPSELHTKYTGIVKYGWYCVAFPDGKGEYLLPGTGLGNIGIVVVPSWLPSVDRVIDSVKLKEK